MPCATRSAGATQSASFETDAPERLATIAPTRQPRPIPPQTPRPPFQIANAPHHSSGSSSQLVIDVVEPRADDSRGDAPDGDAKDEIPVAAAPRPADSRDRDRGRDGHQQSQTVEVDRERPELDRARLGRRNRQKRMHRRAFCRHGAGRVRRTAALQENLERELDRAPALEQAHRRVEVYVVARREHDRRLGVVPRALERLVTPLLDSIALGHVYELSSAADIPPPFTLGIGVTCLFVHYDVSDAPFPGGLS